METFPAFFPLVGRRVVIAGEGEAAKAKARLFEGSPAQVVRLTGAAAHDPAAYAGAALAFVAGGDLAFVTAAAAAARAAGAPVNVVDHPALCDFQTPAIVDRGQVVAAVGTAGAAPVMAQILRAELEARIPPAAGEIARLLAERREEIRAAWPDLARRRGFFRRVLLGPGGTDAASAAQRVDEALTAPDSRIGSVVFVIAPDEADRLSLRAVQALNIADAVAPGPGAGAGDIVARHARRDAERLPAADPARLAEAAGEGLLVVVVADTADPLVIQVLAEIGVATTVLAPAP
jgi:precorrin-2 dehydrogenase/sirohydrochlorin ferrochelatase